MTIFAANKISMTDHEKKVTDMIKKKIMEKDPTAEVILFGSHARGDATKDSDWDILILVNKPNFQRAMAREYRDPLFEVELEIEEVITALVKSKEDWETKYVPTPLYQNIKEQGVRLT
jgi:predicted nucleotidyltransferase